MFKKDSHAECMEDPSPAPSAGRATMLSSLEDSKEAEVLPADAHARQWLVKKSGKAKKPLRILTLSVSRKLGKAFFTWSDKLGEPKNHMVIGPRSGMKVL